MEAIRLLIDAVGLVLVGCAATIVSAHLVPLSIRVLGQPHGRFAGLSGANQACSGGNGSKLRANTPAGLRARLASSLTAA
jgi:hypothetical protein